MAKATPKKKTSATTKSRKPTSVVFGGLFWTILLRASLAFILCLGGYLFYLDRQIQHRFVQGIHPQPAHVYSRSERIAPEGGIELDQLVRTLKFHGYRNVPKVDGPGSYVVVGNQMDLSINPVADHPDQPDLVRLQFKGKN